MLLEHFIICSPLGIKWDITKVHFCQFRSSYNLSNSVPMARAINTCKCECGNGITSAWMIQALVNGMGDNKEHAIDLYRHNVELFM